MKRKIVTALATAALTVGIGTVAAQPAYADDPAVTGCFFNPLYEDPGLTDLIVYIPAQGKPLTVTEGNGDGTAWHVIVEDRNLEGWMPWECVRFFA